MSDNKLTVGSRVQSIQYDAKFVKDGTIENLIPAKRVKPDDYWKGTPAEQAEMVTYIDVKWDDGSTEHLDLDEVSEPDTEMERDFRKAHWATEDRIQEKLDQAAELIREATRISEETGVAFRAYVSPVSNAYFPRSKEEKFSELNDSFISEVTEAYNEYDSTGWRHSAVC